jgi:hypothetical protein
MWYPTRFGKQLYLLALLLVSAAAGGSEFSLKINDIASSGFNAHGIMLSLPANGSAELRILQLNVQQRVFHNVQLHCGELQLSSAQLACRNGSLDALPETRLDFTYVYTDGQLRLSLNGAGGESWQVTGRMGERDWQLAVQLHNAQLKRLNPLLHAALPIPNQGALNGGVRISGNASGANQLSVEVALQDAGFSDTAGLHAAEKLTGNIKFSARRSGTRWNWQGDIAYQSGELYWQPLYLKGGQTVSASGSFDGHLLKVEQAAVELPEVGRIQLSAAWDIQKGLLQEGSVRGDTLKLAGLFEIYAKPFLDKGVLAESLLNGQADVAMRYSNGAWQRVRVNLHDAGVADTAQRFALRGVNSTIDWQADTIGVANISFAGGALLGVPIGAAAWQVHMDGLKFDMDKASLPVLDGKIELADFHLHPSSNQAGKSSWQWQFSAGLGPISMEKISAAAGWPLMLGKFAGRIPRVSYDGDTINVDGALLFDVFDGTVVATKMQLSDAFGRAPLLSGNLTMRNLDLDLLTRTFSFGNMQGRLDVDVNNLQLQNWTPVRFDARLYSSAGDYPKKISQKAVQNISSLGGAGAAAAIQRSYLSFFKNFGYDRIGWSCILRNGVCEMGGIEQNNNGMYAIIKGGGIPAISVMGYNRAVSWGELLTRLKRVTQNNVKPVIQ